jgi:hypothetical protein
MGPITTAVDVAGPPEETFAYATDPGQSGQEGVVDGHMETQCGRAVPHEPPDRFCRALWLRS